MAEISTEELKKAITELLKNMDLATTRTKDVVLALEKKFGTNLSEKKKLIDKLLNEYVDSLESDDDAKSSMDEDQEEEPPKKKPSKKKLPEQESEDDEKDISDEEPKIKTRGGGKKKPVKKKITKGKATKKLNAFTRPCKLSPELAELLGAKEMARCEVVKRMTALVKERQLLDPNNRQFTICDKELFNIFGTRRFLTFGMMKYLKHHILKDE